MLGINLNANTALVPILLRLELLPGNGGCFRKFHGIHYTTNATHHYLQYILVMRNILLLDFR